LGVGVVRVGDGFPELDESFFVIIDSPTTAAPGNAVGELSNEDHTIIIINPTLRRSGGRR
jgi:hypothetical protein